MPNSNSREPEILLIKTKFLCVSFLLNFPARTTFNTSAARFTIIQVENITILSFIVCETARVVDIVSQKAKTAGFNVLIKNPAAANLAWVPAETEISAASVRISIFLKKR